MISLSVAALTGHFVSVRGHPIDADRIGAAFGTRLNAVVLVGTRTKLTRRHHRVIGLSVTALSGRLGPSGCHTIDAHGIGAGLRTRLDTVIVVQTRTEITRRYNRIIGIAGTIGHIGGFIAVDFDSIFTDPIDPGFRPYLGAIVGIGTGTILTI